MPPYLNDSCSDTEMPRTGSGNELGGNDTVTTVNEVLRARFGPIKEELLEHEAEAFYKAAAAAVAVAAQSPELRHHPLQNPFLTGKSHTQK